MQEPKPLPPGANPKRPAMHGKTPGKKLLSAVLPQVEKWRQAPPPTPEEAQALQELQELHELHPQLQPQLFATENRLLSARASALQPQQLQELYELHIKDL